MLAILNTHFQNLSADFNKITCKVQTATKFDLHQASY